MVEQDSSAKAAATARICEVRDMKLLPLAFYYR
jgi:hypothetical protein